MGNHYQALILMYIGFRVYTDLINLHGDIKGQVFAVWYGIAAVIKRPVRSSRFRFIKICAPF